MNVKEIIEEVGSKTQGSRPRTQNNPRPRTNPLEAKDRNAPSQGPSTQRARVFQKKGSPQIYREVSGAFFKTMKKKVMTLAHFLQNQKTVLSSTANKHFRGLVGLEAKDFKMCSRGRRRGIHL